MSTQSYDASLRGKLIVVGADSSNRVYSSPSLAGRTSEFITGPETAGTASGQVYTDGSLKWVEVIRLKGGLVVWGVPQVTKIYLLYDDVTVKTNPNYDPTIDIGFPDKSSKPTNDDKTTNAGSSTDSSTSSDSDVSTTPGKGKVPVTADDGKVVYVPVPQQTNTALDGPVTTTTTPNKWLTYGLYGILGLGVITLITILVLSLRKPKPQSPRPALPLPK